MAAPELIGEYAAPAVKVGDRVRCLYRRADCVVVSWTDAPIPWPRVRAVGVAGVAGLWVNGTLSRAVRTESAAALAHWFGVGPDGRMEVAEALGVGGHAATPGSRRAMRSAMANAHAALMAKVWTPEERKARGDRAKRSGYRPPNRWAGGRGGWTPDELALLGTDSDDAIAARVGRSRSSVVGARIRAGVPVFKPR